jgi:hypothetical protein
MKCVTDFVLSWRFTVHVNTAHSPFTSCGCRLCCGHFRGINYHKVNQTCPFWPFGDIVLVLNCKDSTNRQKREIYHTNEFTSLSLWPCGLRHEPSSPARTLGSWVHISLETWKCVCVYSVFVLSYVGRWTCYGLIPCPRITTGCVKIKKLKVVCKP